MFRFEGWPSGGPWQITAFGRITANESVPGERLIEIQLSPLPYRDLTPESIVTVRAPIGALGQFRCGSLWKDGQPFDGVVPSQRRSELKTDIPMEPRVVLGGYTIGGESLIPPSRRRLAGEAAMAPYLALPLEGRPDRILIPLPEIARTWYLRSTELANRLMADPLTVALGQMAILDPPAPGSAERHITIRSGLGEQDIPTIAMLTLNGFARNRAELLFDQLAKAYASKDKGVYLRVLPPISGPAELVARGIWFASAGDTRFLVDHFEKVPLPTFPPIAWNFERDTRGLLDESGTKIYVGEADEQFNYPPKRTVADDVLVTRNQAPSNRTVTKEVGVLMPEFDGIPLIKRDPPRGKPLSTLRLAMNKEDPQDVAATGVSNWASDGPSPLRLTRKQSSEESSEPSERKPRLILPASFESIKELRDHIQNQPGWSARATAITEQVVDIDGVACSSFGPQWGWCRVDGRSRRLLALEITYKQFYVYALEIERRQEANRPSEQFSLALVHYFGKKVEAEKFALLLKQCIEKKGVWPVLKDGTQARPDGLVITRVPHSHKDIGSLAFSVMARTLEWQGMRLASESHSQTANG